MLEHFWLIISVVAIPIYYLMYIPFVVSVPLHELSHYLCLIALGARTDNITIEFLNFSWQDFSATGKVNSSIFGFEFPWRFRNYRKQIAFIFGLSGGLGSALLMLFLIFYPLWRVGYLHPFIVFWVTPTIIAELIYSIFEAFDSLQPEQLRGIVFTRRNT